MIKVIKQGDITKKPVRQVTCPVCECEFRFDRSDLRTDPRMLSCQPSQFIECPNCEHAIFDKFLGKNNF